MMVNECLRYFILYLNAWKYKSQFNAFTDFVVKPFDVLQHWFPTFFTFELVQWNHIYMQLIITDSNLNFEQYIKQCFFFFYLSNHLEDFRGLTRYFQTSSIIMWLWGDNGNNRHLENKQYFHFEFFLSSSRFCKLPADHERFAFDCIQFSIWMFLRYKKDWNQNLPLCL